jgi:SAM-dependent methyltransferase
MATPLVCLFEMIDPQATRQAMDAFRIAFFDDLALDEGARLLALCGGTGPEAAMAAERVGPRGSVVSLDLNSVSTERARHRFARLGLANARSEQGDVLDQRAVPDERFECLTCAFSLHHFERREDVLGLWARWAQPGALLGLIEWLPLGPDEIFEPVRRAVAAVLGTAGLRLIEPWVARDLALSGSLTEVDGWRLERAWCMEQQIEYPSLDAFWETQLHHDGWATIRARADERFIHIEQALPRSAEPGWACRFRVQATYWSRARVLTGSAGAEAWT